MITMEMRDEDMPQLIKLQFVFAELNLGSFSTVNQKQFVSQTYNLSRIVMLVGGQRAAAT